MFNDAFSHAGKPNQSSLNHYRFSLVGYMIHCSLLLQSVIAAFCCSLLSAAKFYSPAQPFWLNQSLSDRKSQALTPTPTPALTLMSADTQNTQI